MTIPQIVKSLNPRTLFLIDGLGALVSALLLGVVLVQLESFIGMPIAVLYYLAGAALLFFLYSLSCYWWFPNKWRPFLRAIAIVNLIYCLITLGLTIYFFDQLSFWGLGYFLIEIIIIVVLAIIELKKAKN